LCYIIFLFVLNYSFFKILLCSLVKFFPHFFICICSHLHIISCSKEKKQYISNVFNSVYQCIILSKQISIIYAFFQIEFTLAIYHINISPRKWPLINFVAPLLFYWCDSVFHCHHVDSEEGYTSKFSKGHLTKNHRDLNGLQMY
jgi:hypothetical protein